MPAIPLLKANMIRMMVQDKEFSKKVTESVQVNGKYFPELQSMLRRVGDKVLEWLKGVPEEHRQLAEEYRDRTIKKLREMGVTENAFEKARN